MLFSWLDASEAKKFGLFLAEFYMKRVVLDAKNRKPFSLAKRQEVENKIMQQLARFKLEHKLNFYKKAQLGNAFKWALKDAGYDPQYVDQFTAALMITLR